MTIGEVLRLGVRRLADVGIESAARDARLLLAHALGCEAARISLMEHDAVTLEAAEAFEALVAKREARQPVAQLVGTRQFWGRDFVVTGDVLDPRPETETLIEAALAGPAATRILDLGTGSGILALTLLAEWPGATAVAVDASEAALAVARRNATRLGLEHRVAFAQASWYDGLDGRFDLIVSNPPYITSEEMTSLGPEVRDWEPHLALEAGPDGLDAYRAIAAGLAPHLAPRARVILEHGAAQGPAVRALFSAWEGETRPDLDGRDRILVLETGP